MSPSFLFYLSIFGFSLAWILRSIQLRRFDNIPAAFILAAFSFISLLLRLWWSDIGNRFGGAGP